jgi:hypothetical protein
MASTTTPQLGSTPSRIQPAASTPLTPTTSHGTPSATVRSTNNGQPTAQGQVLPPRLLQLESKNVPLSAINDDPVLDARAAAAFLGVKVGCLKKWRFRNQGPDYIQYGINGPVRYRLSTLKAYLVAMTVRLLEREKK